MMTEWYASTDYASETKMANVFDAQEDESLYQIAYRTSLPQTKVTYEIYKDVESDAPASGSLLEKGENSHYFEGFFKIDLKNEYPLNKGERYSVVITMKRTSEEDGSTVYTEVFPYSTEFSNGLTIHGIINKGESYLYTDGKWRDMSASTNSLINRAYEQCSVIYDSKDTFTDIALDSKTTFTVDNYAIKAILAPANR